MNPINAIPAPTPVDAPGSTRDALVLAHLRAATSVYGAAAPLWGMPAHEWSAAITSLSAAGHTIRTVTLTQGDRACNETGYQLVNPGGPP